MAKYLARRLARTGLVLFGLITLTFALSRTIADPVQLMLPITASQESRDRLTTQLGLDRPLIHQYVDYIGGILRGDFGESIWQQQPALGVVMNRLPATIMLASSTLLLAVTVGLPLGFVGGMRPGSWADRMASTLASVAVSIPDFWFAIVLITVFAVRLHWLPTSGYGDWTYLVLPTLALGLRPAGRLAGVTREAVAGEMQRRYVTAARAKGMRRNAILRQHVLKNVMNPCLTIAGYDFVFVFTGYAVGVETVFDWPGVGRLAVQATLQHDVTLLSAAVVVTGTLIALVNMALDVIQAAIDRRVAV